MEMKTQFFTFGQSHSHVCNGVTLDRNIVVKITHHDPMSRMFELFGHHWSMQYDSCPDLSFYPRGVIEIN